MIATHTDKAEDKKKIKKYFFYVFYRGRQQFTLAFFNL